MALKRVDYNGEKFRLSYDIVNPDKKRSILFLHGWGSDKELMKQAFSSNLEEFRHIYLDLPGFGKSGNDSVLTTHDYAAIVGSFLALLETTPYAAVGHSFGGKVATLLQPERLVLLSSAGIPQPKPLKVRAKIALFKLLKPLGGDELRKLFVSADAAGMPQNMYETFKNVVDENFRSSFASFSSPALICWGTRDSATPLTAGREIAEIMPNATLEVFEGDHYFFLGRRDQVAGRIGEFLEKV
ncbi:2-hydroxy-6-oxohepta-2,4-dienoate hydrolase [Hydrogenimonas sp.]|nr:2-hydroxy-6-oxohepta-2,4-dienoate hydrolase [Hydrogenimonas sp.]